LRLPGRYDHILVERGLNRDSRERKEKERRQERRRGGKLDVKLNPERKGLNVAKTKAEPI